MNPDRIIVERLHAHWSAWFDGMPQVAFGGQTGTATGPVLPT